MKIIRSPRRRAPYRRALFSSPSAKRRHHDRHELMAITTILQSLYNPRLGPLRALSPEEETSFPIRHALLKTRMATSMMRRALRHGRLNWQHLRHYAGILEEWDCYCRLCGSCPHFGLVGSLGLRP